MKNKDLKKLVISILVVLFTFLIGYLGVSKLEYARYNNLINKKINGLIEVIKEKNPDISDAEIIDILNNKESKHNYLNKYGYSISDSFIEENNANNLMFLIMKVSLIIILGIVIIYLLSEYFKKNNQRIDKLIKSLAKINMGNYEIDLRDLEEDKLSILKEELYKTTVMLKSMAENNLQDKIKLKNSLEDISHQLKTPLTAIYIALDNIIDDTEMDNHTKEHFIMQIKREVTNINFLVASLLKLSKFEANTITFQRHDYNVKEIIDEAVLNVNSLSDLKNIKIIVNDKSNVKIKCDFNWEIEAITNILKNSLEHSKDNSQILIDITNNNIYLEVKITDFGVGISPKDLQHIFERFYKSQNSHQDSVGIGLALAKAIVEEDNGRIMVESKLNKGTTFKIKYYFN